MKFFASIWLSCRRWGCKNWKSSPLRFAVSFFRHQQKFTHRSAARTFSKLSKFIAVVLFLFFGEMFNYKFIAHLNYKIKKTVFGRENYYFVNPLDKWKVYDYYGVEIFEGVGLCLFVYNWAKNINLYRQLRKLYRFMEISTLQPGREKFPLRLKK